MKPVKHTDFLSYLLMESESYKNFDDIEKLVESGVELSSLPLQPLYLSLRTTPADQLSMILPKLSSEQRQAILDIDVWQKDNLDIESFENWPLVFARCGDHKVVKEFARSNEFLLYLKSKFTVYTFDLENPQYPDHDNFFLTDDNQFLLEYDSELGCAKEVQFLVRMLFADLGVEEANALLMRLINDSFYSFQEEIYQDKRNRLIDYGFVDYFDALEIRSAFPNLSTIDHYISKKTATTGEIDAHSKNQSLHSTALLAFKKGLESIHESLEKVKSEKRIDYLQFNFVRLVNANITLDDSLKEGSIAITRTGNKVRSKILLGYDYALRQSKNKNIFDVFDFTELFKIGNSLINLPKNKIKKSIENTPFEQDDFEYFMGQYWNTFVTDSMDDIPKLIHPRAEKAKEIATVELYEIWRERVETFVQILPFIKTFFETIQKLNKEGKLNDNFYLNYTVDNIDFESILLSSFANFSLGNYQNKDVNKMGLTTSEFKKFIDAHFELVDGNHKLRASSDKNLQKKVQDFAEAYGFGVVKKFEAYLYEILDENLSNYNFNDLKDEDFRHVGGPILLNTLKN
ncbi:MAG: hypothetical protein JNM93_13540 [Bacteriovoracaceae bacterium]|nr:hypothetical protein [Bacteriovoracaceae bacterium]